MKTAGKLFVALVGALRLCASNTVAQSNPPPILTNAAATSILATTNILSRYGWAITTNAGIANSSTNTANTTLAISRTRKRGLSVQQKPPANKEHATVTAVGPNSRTWSVAGTNSSPAGTDSATHPHRVVELATGMHYQQGKKWVPSTASFEETTNGFAATHTQHKVFLHSDISIQGAVEVITRDGVVLHSTPLGIGLYDAATGNFVLIGQTTNSTGVLVASNKVVYPNAFSGVCANLVYTTQRGSFEQDVVFTGSLDPTAYGFPADTTRIQIITEFFDPPKPRVRQSVLRTETNRVMRAKMASPDLTDQTLGFGEFNLVRGYANVNGSGSSTNKVVNRRANVGKSFTSSEGRSFLVESIDYNTAKAQLQALPQCDQPVATSGLKLQKGPASYANLPILPAATSIVSAVPKNDSLNKLGHQSDAKLHERLTLNERDVQKGFVVDYIATVGGVMTDDFTFQNDTTYFLSDNFACSGNVTLEGGAVLKYAAPWSPDGTEFFAGELDIYGGFTCTGGNYLPVILTASDDDSVGQSLSGIDPNYTGLPAAADPAPGGYGFSYLNFGEGLLPASNLRISYAATAMIGSSGSTPAASFNNIQFVNCGGVLFDLFSDAATPVTFNNCLIAHVQTPFTDLGNAQPYVFNQCTFDQDTQLEVLYPIIDSTPPAFYVTNSIFSNMLDDWRYLNVFGRNNGFFSTLWAFDFGSYPTHIGYYPFQTCEAGKYYLAPATFQNLGTGALDPALIAQMQNKTTEPPTEIPLFYYTTGNLTLFPKAKRFAADSTHAPDLGFHYDALDYTIANMIVDGGTLTVEPGTSIGVRNEAYPGYYSVGGLALNEGSSLVSHGTPTRPVTYVDCHLVQEGPFLASWTSTLMPLYVPPGFPDDLGNPQNVNGLPPASLDLRFCNFYASHESYQFWSGHSPFLGENISLISSVYLNMCDCNLHGGFFLFGLPDTGYLIQYEPGVSPVSPGSIALTNNLFDDVITWLVPQYPIELDDGSVDQIGPDLQLTAYNNLYRRGALIMLPVDSTQHGNWTWSDNLFDQTIFWMDTALPLDYSHNAYWPCAADDNGLAWWQATYPGSSTTLSPTTPGDGTTDGTGDVTLTLAPPYQSGPLGNYYLPTNTPLYQAGSTTADQLGLYHYTTQTNQVKAANATVSIGLHYLAASNSLPMDTDGDGIPDYVENWHGDGNYPSHTDTETDWQNPYTTAGVFDPSNSVYENIDLSGNGFVGSIKYAVGMAPFGINNTLQLTQIITGYEPDIVSYELPLNYGTMTNIGNLTLKVDGVEATLYTINEQTNGNCLIQWETTFTQPGCHLISAKLTIFGASGGTGDVPDPTVLSADGQVSIYQVTNILNFDPFYSEYTSDGWLFAQLTATNASYTIQLYDPSTNLFRTISGSTASGQIHEYWDGNDSAGNPYTNTSASAVFSVTPSGGAAEAHTEILTREGVLQDGTFSIACAYHSAPNTPYIVEPIS